jgi:class 3 adenylate cyclase
VKVALMVTCINDAMFPDTGRAVVTLLRRLGVEVDFPQAQTCCGQPMVNTGYLDEAVPPLRAGVASGQAVHRWGDWFGTPVNLASRLTTRARPSTVLVAEEVRAAVDGRFEFSDAGRKKLKGFSAPVRAYRARRFDG